MSVVSIERTNGQDLSDAEARAAAQQAWRRSEAAGEPLTGVDLGRMFGRTDRWGRKQIERARQSVDVPTERPSTIGTPATAETPALLLRNAIPPAGTVSDNGTDGKGLASGSEQMLDAGAVLDIAGGRRADDPAAMWSRRLIRWVTTVAVIVVAACAARSSYDHQRLVVDMAGNHKAAWYLPLVRHEALITMRVRDPPPVVAATGRS
jgi:hypothetical protein